VVCPLPLPYPPTPNITHTLLPPPLAPPPCQAGIEPEEISLQLDLLSRDEPDCVDALKRPDSPDPLPYHTLKLHSPPR